MRPSYGAKEPTVVAETDRPLISMTNTHSIQQNKSSRNKEFLEFMKERRKSKTAKKPNS
jgi:hypothetical protein